VAGFPLANHLWIWHYHRIAMYRLLKIIAALAVLVCVLGIFVAPTIDLPDVNLRSRNLHAAMLQSMLQSTLQSMSTLLLLALLAAGSLLSTSPVSVYARARSARSSSHLTC
jgi:hypothetical protein